MRVYHLIQLIIISIQILFNQINSINAIEYCPTGSLVIVKGLTPSDEEAATNAHNRVRNDLKNGNVKGQPKATNLKTMSYDQTLAHKATPVSKQCAPTPIEVKDKRWPCVAQNIYLICSDKFNPNEYWDEAVDFWFSERQYFKYPNGNPANRDVSHYRQLAWAETDTFGCDFYLYISTDDPCKPFCKLYTCNYGCCANHPTNADSPPYECE